MKRMLVMVGLLLAIGVGAAAAQTRVSVSLGFGIGRPYAAGYVIVGRPDRLYRSLWGYRRPALVIVEPAPIFVRRPWRSRLYYYRPYHRFGACWDHRCRF